MIVVQIQNISPSDSLLVQVTRESAEGELPTFLTELSPLSEMITKLSPDVTDNSDMITMVEDISSECTMKGVLQVEFLLFRLLWWFHSLCSFKLSHTDN